MMAERAGKYAATLFFAGPTFFSNMLRAGLPGDALAGVRLAALFVAEYPTTVTGKIRRVDLRAQAAAIMQAAVS